MNFALKRQLSGNAFAFPSCGRGLRIRLLTFSSAVSSGTGCHSAGSRFFRHVSLWNGALTFAKRNQALSAQTERVNV
jgi:hypothetical protein